MMPTLDADKRSWRFSAADIRNEFGGHPGAGNKLIKLMRTTIQPAVTPGIN
jgi:hypothetical protein